MEGRDRPPPAPASSALQQTVFHSVVTNVVGTDICPMDIPGTLHYDADAGHDIWMNGKSGVDNLLVIRNLNRHKMI